MPLRIIIGSTRLPKIEGAKRGVVRALSALDMSGTQVTFECAPAESGVSPMPRSLEEIQTGARNRAIGVFREGSEGALAIGLEGGLFASGEGVFLQSWACVYDGATLSFGASGAVELPEALARRVMVEGEELGEAIDVLAGRSDIRSAEGTWGVLTRNAVTREDSFSLAVLNALMPLFNHQVYNPRRR
jgi:inosine/xanthosine triphosphatase